MTGPVRYCIKHTSRYVYSSPVSKSAMTLCFRPREDDGQSLLSFEIKTIPAISLTSETDYFGNIKHFLIVHQPHELLEITALSTVEPGPKEPLPESLAPETWAEIQAWRDSVEYWDFMHPSRFARSCPELSNFMSGHGLDKAEGDPLSALVHLTGTLYEAFQYVPGSTSAVSPIEHILESGKGVCQDYAHVMISIARSWGVPSRYVSGYLYVEDDVGPADSGSGRTCVGGMSGFRGSGGWDSTRRTTGLSGHSTCGLRWAGTITTWPRLGGYSGGVGIQGWRLRCGWSRYPALGDGDCSRNGME